MNHELTQLFSILSETERLLAENYKLMATEIEMIVPLNVFVLPGKDGFENNRARVVNDGRSGESVCHSAGSKRSREEDTDSEASSYGT